MRTITILAIVVAAAALAACGGDKGNACAEATEKARACATELCEAGTLDAFDQEKWCGETTPLDDPAAKACETSRCAEQMKEHTDRDDCMRVLNGYSNALEIACK